MYVSEQMLRQIIAGTPVGDIWPYNSGSEDAIEQHLRNCVAQLGLSTQIIVEADFDHYGSGYASYVDVFCYKNDGSSTRHRDETLPIDGLTIYLCRLAPVAVYGRNHKTRDARGGSSGFLNAENVDTTPPGQWESIAQEINKNLASLGFELLDRDTVSRELPFKADISTILGDEHIKSLTHSSIGRIET